MLDDKDGFASLIRTVELLNSSKMSDKLNSLVWFKQGIGWYPVVDYNVYNDDYFQRYVGYKGTEIGKKINEFRVELVRRHTKADVVDIGSGAGHFLELIGGNSKGYDVNYASIEWLKSKDKYIDPLRAFAHPFKAMTFWDSIEHIHRFWDLLRLIDIGGFVFMTVPVFKDMFHVTESKHFRTNEHFWYFTAFGLLKMMGYFGFDFLESRNVEVMIGREDVATFVFKKVSNGFARG